MSKSHVNGVKISLLSANSTKWSNTLKQFKFVGSFPTICLSAFYHFVWLALKGSS